MSLLYRWAGAKRSSTWSWRSSYLDSEYVAVHSAARQINMASWYATATGGQREQRVSLLSCRVSAHPLAPLPAHLTRLERGRRRRRTKALRPEMPAGVKHLLGAEGAKAEVSEREPQDDGATRAVVFALGTDARHVVVRSSGAGWWQAVREVGRATGGGSRGWNQGEMTAAEVALVVRCGGAFESRGRDWMWESADRECE